ncbi:MAG TPA: gluconate 2-dehydrogenase subunit 3 family protein [Terriglobia bacterium]|nr:gluconate 2-dehydrogenase subunit 3 family protein [Terriglobia bacterium]
MDNNESKSHDGLKRRDMLKVLGAVPAAALLPAAAAAAEMPMPKPGAPSVAEPAATAYEPKTLSAHEYKTVVVLSDIIIPADERSGSATQAGVPEFIDDWLSAGGGSQLDSVRGGITWLDLESNRTHNHDFIDASESEKKQLLDRIAYPKTAAPEDAAGVVFFNQIRNLVLSGFYSSKMGIEDLPYLGNKMLSEWNGCPPNVLAKLGVEYADAKK